MVRWRTSWKPPVHAVAADRPEAGRAIRPAVTGLGAYRFTPHEAEVVLDQNESPYGLPETLRDEAAQLAASVALNRYPDLEPRRLRARLAEVSGWPADGIAVAGGSNVLIQAAVLAAGIGRTVLTVAPTFSVYGLQARIAARNLVEVPLGPDFSLPVEQLEEKLKEGSGVLFVASPAAPTGNSHPQAELERLADAAGDRWLFVVDEAYHEFAGTDLSGFARGRPGTVVLRTLSKAAGLAGLRLGYALTDPFTAEQLRKVVMPFSVSALQEELGLLLLRDPERLKDNVRRTVQERERLQAALGKLPDVTVFPSAANFMLFRVPAAASVHAGLLERSVLVRRQDHLPQLEGCLRVSVGLPAENSAFLEALAEVMTETGGNA